MAGTRTACILASLLAACSWLACRKANNPPHILSMTATPSYVLPGDSSVVAATAQDEDGDPLAFRWSASSGSMSVDSGAQVTWKAPASPASCTVQLVVSDPPGASDTSRVEILVVANQPPSALQLSGPAHGRRGDTLTYTFSATDPENQDVEYMVAWGDTTIAEWSEPHTSGQAVTQPHVFGDSGTYHVRFKARDTRLAESGWSDSLNVSIVLAHGGSPTGVAVSAGPGDSDSTVVISWTTPADSTPDKYIICFRPITDSGYAVVGETTATSYAHNPHGMTGQYKVAALFGSHAYEGVDRPSTVPIESDAAMLSEINADASRCGFGWTRDSGAGRVYSMAESASCRFVDLYVSDLQAAVGGPLVIVSPDKAGSIDPGAVGIVPSAAWRTRGFSDPLPDPQSPLPGWNPPPVNYFVYTQVTTEPCYIACVTAGDTIKHYALIQVDSFDVASGRLWMKSWYQLVPGLTLIRH